MMVFSSLVVLEQFVEDFHKYTADVRAIAVCSLPECEHFTVAAEVSGIKKELKSKQKVLFLTTYDSVHKIDEALADLKMMPLDLAIFDEAQNVHTPKRAFLWGGEDKIDDEEEMSGHEEEGTDDGIKETFEPTKDGIGRLNKLYPRRIYLTATPRDAMTKYSEVYGRQERDWDTLTYSDLVEAQKGYDKKCVKEFDVCITFNGRPSNGKNEAEFYDRVSVLRAALRRDAQRVMMYHAYAHKECGCRSAENFADIQAWKDAFNHLKPREKKGKKFRDLKIYSVTGADGEKDVSEKLKDFNSKDKKMHILCSCSIFKEGVTLERCDLTVFADGKRSYRDIIQSGLRGVKYDVEKPDSRLAILILINLDGIDIAQTMNDATISESIKSALRSRDKMEGLAAVLSSLKSENHELAQYIMELAGSRAPRREDDEDEVVNAVHEGDGGGEDLAPVDEPEEKERADSFDADTLEDEGRGGIVTKTKPKKQSVLKLEMEPELLQWRIAEATLLHISQSLISDVIIELTTPATSPREIWERRFAELVTYKSIYKNTQVPWHWQGNKQLAIWVVTQRKFRHKGGLSADRRQRLDDIGFVWGAARAEKPDELWARRFAELVAYKSKYKNLKVPKTSGEHKQLATWVNQQRKKKNTMVASRRRKLDAIGFVWAEDVDERWERRFAELVAYRSKYKSASVPKNWAENRQLATWVDEQRAKRTTTMGAARRQKLDGIGFVWARSQRRAVIGFTRAARSAAGSSETPVHASGGTSTRAKRVRDDITQKNRALPAASSSTTSMRRSARDSSSSSSKRKRLSVKTAPLKQEVPPQKRGPKRPQSKERKTQLPTLEDASIAFQEERQQQCEDGEDTAKKKRKKNIKYDATNFSQSHTDFKNKVLSVIVGRCSPDGRKLRAAFLDDFTEDKVTLRTTQALLDSGKFVAEDLYCANPCQQVVDGLEKKGVNAVCGVFTDACKKWEDATFDVAYVDLCTGSADEVLKNLEAVLPRMKPESILAYTITGRSGSDAVPDGEHDKTWHTMGNRVTRVHAALDKAPHNYKHIGAFDRDENGVPNSPGAARAQSEIFYSDGARGARVCTGIFRRVPDKV